MASAPAPGGAPRRPGMGAGLTAQASPKGEYSGVCSQSAAPAVDSWP